MDPDGSQSSRIPFSAAPAKGKAFPIPALEALRGKAIAVTGASGYIGSAVVDALMPYCLNILGVSRHGLIRRGVRSSAAAGGSA